MGDGDRKNVNEQSNEPPKTFKADPLAKFEAELSMDGDSFKDDLSLNFSDTKSNLSQSFNINKNTQNARPLSFLGAIGTNNSESKNRGSLGLSFRDTDSCTSQEHIDHIVNDKEVLENIQEKRKRSESGDYEPDNIFNNSQNLEPQQKRFCASVDLTSDYSEKHIENTFKSFGKSIEAKYTMLDKEVEKEFKTKNISEKENWNEIEQRLSKAPEENIHHKDVYTLGFEEEEDVYSAKISAAAGRTALLPLHDSNNTSKSSVRNLQKERLIDKVQSGKANENYQKINLKKKVFVIGRAGRMTGAKFRRQEWKKKMNQKEKAALIPLL